MEGYRARLAAGQIGTGGEGDRRDRFVQVAESSVLTAAKDTPITTAGLRCWKLGRPGIEEELARRQGGEKGAVVTEEDNWERGRRRSG